MHSKHSGYLVFIWQHSAYEKIQILMIFYPYKLYSCLIHGTVDAAAAADRICTAAGSSSVGHLYHPLLCVYVHLGCLACECEILNMICPLLNWQVQRKRPLGIL